VRKIIFALAFGALLLPDSGFTLGLGEIEVTTALNQELNAEIELLSAVPEDVETLIVKLASREEFNRAGIDRPYMLNSLKFTTDIRNGVPFIRVTSEKPVREPFLSFLLEVDWPKGHMMREYTILLDPPVFLEQQAPAQQDELRPAVMESSPPAARGVSEPQSSSGFRPAVMGAAAPAPSAVPVSGVQTTQSQAPYQAETAYTPHTQSHYQSPGGYRVQQGDTLWSLADAMRPDQSVSIEQMMLAMLRSNPEAFINENVNGLKRGYILRIPDGDDIVTINQDEAVALVREQNALWREYYQAVAGGETASAMDREDDGSAGAGLDENGDSRLEIVAAGSGVSASGGAKDPTQMSPSELRAELAIAREALETERVEKEELNQRVVSLEGQVNRMKSLLTLEDSDLAEMQQVATPAEGGEMPEAGASDDAMLEKLADVEIDETGDETAAAGDAGFEDVTETEEVTDEAATEEGGEQPVFLEEGQVDEVVEDVVEQPETSTEDFSVTQNTAPAFMQQQKQNPLAMLLNNPALLAAAGGGLLLVLLLIALILKRRKSGDEEPFVTSNLDTISDQVDDRDVIREVEDEQVKLEMAEAEAEAETVTGGLDEAEAAAIQPLTEDTVATPAEAEAEEAPRDDVIAEADVYLAYGIYQQAEELLQNAIKDNPDKDSYRVKLAETYLAGKNSDGFIELATDMNQRRGNEDTPAWQKIVAIGQQLVPGHAVLAGSSAGGLSMDDDPASQSPEPIDFNPDSEEDQQALAPELDLAFDTSEAGIVDASEAELASAESVAFDLSDMGAEAEAETEENMEFGLGETESNEANHATEEFSLDIAASELGIEDEEAAGETDAGEFELDLSAEAEDVLATDEASLDFDTSDSALEELDVGESPDDATAVLDLSEASMDEAVVEMVAKPASAASSTDDDLDLSELDDIDEVGTKLDLAKAYLDMGDADGTRSILDEVMTEGNDDQKKEADDLLRQLG